MKIKLNTSEPQSILYTNIKSSKIEANLFSYIEEILITKNDGIKYYFGGDQNAIEFSYKQHSKYYKNYNTNEMHFVGTANSWLLRKIEYPNGEIISFNYQKSGTLVVAHESHSAQAYLYIDDSNSQNFLFDTRSSHQYNSYSFSFIQPSYLTSIKSHLTKNEIFFKTQNTNELGYNISKEIFEYKVGQFSGFTFADLMMQNYYLQLIEIEEKNKTIKLQFSNDARSRLKLLSVLFWLFAKNSGI